MQPFVSGGAGQQDRGQVGCAQLVERLDAAFDITAHGACAEPEAHQGDYQIRCETLGAADLDDRLDGGRCIRLDGDRQHPRLPAEHLGNPGGDGLRISGVAVAVV